MTAVISFAFMIRNTSPVGWVPLLALKIIQEGSLLPFIISGVLVAIPIIIFCIFMDSMYYGGEQWTFTSYNFLNVNLLYGLSKFFGEDPWWWYLAVFASTQYIVVYPFLLYQTVYGHIKTQWSKSETPHLAYYILFYFVFFSVIAHKEARFLLPILPFCILLIG